MSDGPERTEPVEVFLRKNDVDASGLLDGHRLTVRAGSTGRARETLSLAEGVRRRREQLIADGALVVDGERLVAQREIEFDSPSGAAMTLLGRHINGWQVWRTTDSTPIDSFRTAPGEAREQLLQRQWFEAHQRSFLGDDGWLQQEQERQAARDASGRDAVSYLRELEVSRDATAFVTGMQAWATRTENKPFNGFSGQMLLNQLVKHGESPAELGRVLADVLRAPSDLVDARAKIQRIVDHIEQIRVGAHPAPGHAAFLLSYFWALQDHAAWPVIWASAASFTEFVSGRLLPAVPADRYAAFVEFIGRLDVDNDQFEWTAAWWAAVRPVLLDEVLVDRCKFGMENPPPPAEVRQRNADALVLVAGHIATRLVDVVSEAAGRGLNPAKPPRAWAGDSPRSDFWANWSAVDNGPSFRLWLTHAGAAIGIVPGVVRAGWLDEATRLIADSDLPGFERYDARDAGRDPQRRIAGGRSGEFIYGKWFDPDQLASLDVEPAVTAIVGALRPLMDELVRRATGQESDAKDPLAPAVAKFKESYPSPKDAQQVADREMFRAKLAADSIALADPSELRRIWNTGRYGSPGPQSNLNVAVRDADAAEYDRIVDTFRYVCWGDGDDAARIDEALDTEGDRYVKGLGESVIMKMLSICHPDRYLPVFPYSGPMGKRRMLQVLELPEPAGDSRGALQVEANDQLRQRLDKFFPGDPWGMAQFLYRYSEGLDTAEHETDETVDPLEKLAEDLLVERSFLDDIVKLLEDKRQVILYGPPGTGKTYLAQKLAEALVPDPSRRPLVQFHPSMSYEDFFEGYRPETDPGGTLSYRLTPGPLALLAARAADAPGKRHIMIIDEINRANLPRVLGELLFLLEYRDVQVPTLYRPDDPFELPADVWFIGTMNTADRSIALVDAALRRRFHFVPFFPNHGPMQGLLERWLQKHGQPEWVGELVAMVNDLLTEALGGPHLQIGPSYFMKKDLGRDAVRRIWEYNIEPFIEDQFFGDPTQIERFRFEPTMAAYLGSVGVASLEELVAAAGESDPSTSIEAVEDLEAE